LVEWHPFGWDVPTLFKCNKPVQKKFYIKTFGCQMNEYDSDKMGDVLRACEGMQQT